MDSKFVSRGGIKLEHALKTFQVDVEDLTVLDVGSSTGGFVDCLLQSGAAKVYSVDTAYGELAWKLRRDDRVIVMERTNILYLDKLPIVGNTQAETPYRDGEAGSGTGASLVDLVTIDVTFTSLTKILPVIKKFMKLGAKITALLKPQYEDQQLAMKHHGIIPDESQAEIVERIKKFATENGFKLLGQADSPILGTGGNKEFLLYLQNLA